MKRAQYLCWLLALLALGAGDLAAQGAAPVFTWQEAVAGDEEHKLRWPSAVAVAGADEFAVADAFGPRLLLFRDPGDATGWRLDRVVDLPAPPRGLAFDGRRYLLSLGRPGGLVEVERPGLEMRSLGGPAKLTPGAVTAMPDGRILVHDLAGERLLMLDTGGGVLRETPVAGNVTALAAGASGDFYVALASPAEVHRYGADGRRLAVLPVPGVAPVPAWPAGLAAAVGGDLILVDRHGGRLLVLDASGQLSGFGSRRGWDPGLLRMPSGIGRFPDGAVVVSDQANGRVQIFRRVTGSGSQ